MIIEHDNIFYANDFNIIGGVETYVYELVKKYKDYDIAVCYKTAYQNQIDRLKELCPVYKVQPDTKIKCKVAIINYDLSIIDQIIEGDIYQTIHGDYSNPHYKRLGIKPPTHDKIKSYIGITKYVSKAFKDMTGKETIFSYNPLSVETKEKPLILLTASRLSPEKGKHRMQNLINELDRQKVNYIWFVFTNDKAALRGKNIIWLEPTLDISKWYDIADYLVQLSDTECCSYAINEMLYRNKPVIVTPLPYLSEIGVEDNKNAYILNFDCSNVKEIVSKITTIPKFEFKKLQDNYDNIVIKGKSKYEEMKKMEVKVKVIKPFKDMQNGNIQRHMNEEFICSKLRAEYLVENKAAEIIEEIKPIETKEEISKPKRTKKTNLKKEQ